MIKARHRDRPTARKHGPTLAYLLVGVLAVLPGGSLACWGACEPGQYAMKGGEVEREGPTVSSDFAFAAEG